MEASQEADRFFAIFSPGDSEQVSEVVTEARLAYYTTANTAKQIIENKEIWFRNALLMSDYSEIQYGLDLMKAAMSGPAGKRFRDTVNGLFPDAVERAGRMLDPHIQNWRHETYLSCWSLHDDAEDQNGRLSMWRAYGDIALVVRNHAFHAFGDQSGIRSLPVHYFSLGKCEDRLERVAESIASNASSIQEGGRRKFETDLAFMLSLAAIRTKHPGFAEENEWRVWFRPTDAQDPKAALEERVVVIAGVPQKVWVLPLRHDPDKGLHHADIDSLLDRIIIGPTAYPYVRASAFLALLEKAGLTDAKSKVVVSEIPLRAQPNTRDAY